MTRIAALLRGINVGGNHKIKMADLTKSFEAAGATDVQTYIQSGNVTFSHSGLSGTKLAAHLEAALKSEYGFAVPVMLRTKAQLAKIIADNPFPDAQDKQLHVLFYTDP